jgi:electron transport complex protein RnfD
VSARGPELVLSTSPFVRASTTTPDIMRELLAVELVVVAFAFYQFGVAALLIVGASIAGAVGTEWLFTRGQRPSPLADWSGANTGVLLGLCLPPALPLWIAFVGGVAGVGLGKLIWGGLGQNLFNPALVGRAFLQAAFPTAITTWSEPVRGAGLFDRPASLLIWPLMHGGVDGFSAATPLGLAKFEGTLVGSQALLLGDTAGSLGETSAALLIACGVWLGVRRIFDWRLPAATLLSVALISAVLHWASGGHQPPPQFMLLSGGLVFAAVFMVTDPVTTPTTPLGAWIFGAGVGALVVLIRLYGGLPEGVMYAILLMNAVVPHINRRTQRRIFGG